MNLFSLPRVKASLIHLAISLFVAAWALALVFGLWYPAPWASTLGVSKIFLIVLGVDLCLGPLLTLVVFAPNKPNLKFDLTVIAALQIAALAYGLTTVADGRPAYLVFSKDRFDAVQAHEVYQSNGEGKAVQLIAQSPWAQPWTGPKLVAADLPKDPDLKDKLMGTALGGGPDVPNLLNLHRPYPSAWADIQSTALKLADYAPKLPKNQAVIQALRSKYPKDALLSPLKVKFEVLTVVLSHKEGAVLGIEAVDVFE